MNGDNLDRTDCTIGMSEDGEVCIVTVPLKKYADDEINGMALFYGKFRELEAHARAEFLKIRMRKAEFGIIPAQKGAPNLKVN